MFSAIDIQTQIKMSFTVGIRLLKIEKPQLSHPYHGGSPLFSSLPFPGKDKEKLGRETVSILHAQL